jgi:hypothetical protein
MSVQTALRQVNACQKSSSIKMESLSAATGEFSETFDSATGTVQDKKTKRVAGSNLGKRTSRMSGGCDEPPQTPDEQVPIKRVRRQ